MSRAHRARRDTSEQAVIATLEACGWRVQKIAQRGVPDLMCWKGQRVRLVEVKTGKGKLRAGTQTAWQEMGLPVAVLRSAEDALAWHQAQTGDRT